MHVPLANLCHFRQSVNKLKNYFTLLTNSYDSVLLSVG